MPGVQAGQYNPGKIYDSTKGSVISLTTREGIRKKRPEEKGKYRLLLHPKSSGSSESKRTFKTIAKKVGGVGKKLSAGVQKRGVAPYGG